MLNLIIIILAIIIFLLIAILYFIIGIQKELINISTYIDKLSDAQIKAADTIHTICECIKNIYNSDYKN